MDLNVQYPDMFACLVLHGLWAKHATVNVSTAALTTLFWNTMSIIATGKSRGTHAAISELGFFFDAPPHRIWDTYCDHFELLNVFNEVAPKSRNPECFAIEVSYY